MHITIGRWLEIDTRAGLFVRLRPFGQLHWSRLGIFADRWSTLKATGEA